MKISPILILFVLIGLAIGCQNSTYGTYATSPGEGPANFSSEVSNPPPTEEEMQHGLAREQVLLLRQRIQESWKLQGLDCDNQATESCLLVAGIRLQMDLMDLGLDAEMTSEQKLGLIRDLDLVSFRLKEFSGE